MPLDRIDGEILFDIDINAMEQARRGTGWTTGWAVTPVSEQLKVSVAEGSGRSEGTVKSTTGATEVALDAAHATHPRKDLIVYDASASALGKVTGIPAAIDPGGTVNPRKMKVPKPPDLGESTDIIIACVYVPANCTDADECTIIDKRVRTLGGGLTSKIITATRDMAAASGDVSYTGVGFQPTALVCLATHTSTTAEDGSGSVGFSDNAKNDGVIARYLQAEGGSQWITSAILVCIFSTYNRYQIATLKSYDADGFTLTWTKSAVSPAGTGYLTFLCLK